MSTFLNCLIGILGLSMSVLWGLRSAALFPNPQHPGWERFYQFTSNFVGSFAGWSCVYALAVRAIAAPDLRSLNGGDAGLFLAALLGLTGHLTQALVGLISAIEGVAAVLAKKAS
jgi:hypothetical protein